MDTIDCIMYNGEKELFDIRYNILKDFVDKFVVVEATKTFSGQNKSLKFPEIQDKYEVKYHVIDDWEDEKTWELARKSPNTQGAEHWKQEFYIKEKIKDALTDLKWTDIVFIGDCDEIPYKLDRIPEHIWKLKLKVYTYWLNNRSDERFWGTIVGKYGDIKGRVLNHLRTRAKGTQLDNGWHFTSLAPYLRQKLLDSYTKETYANDWVMENLEKNIENNRDFLGRSFRYWIDESGWPEYLLENKEKYKHLLKDNAI